MSEFRDRLGNEVINAAGHPKRARDTLSALEEGMGRKIAQYLAEDARDSNFVNGMMEMRVLVFNLTRDIEREYGIEKEKGN